MLLASVLRVQTNLMCVIFVSECNGIQQGAHGMFVWHNMTDWIVVLPFLHQ